MIPGSVNTDGVPTIPINVAGRTWWAVIDTGFNGDLELPEDLRPFLNPRFFTRSESLLAAGQFVYEDILLVDFPFDGQTVQAEASFVAGTDILVGTGLLQSYRLEVNFAAGTVVLERVA